MDRHTVTGQHQSDEQLGAAHKGEVTHDAFLGGLIVVQQPRAGYRAGVDAVLLAASVVPQADGAPRVLDLGAGVGVAGLCVARRIAGARVVLVEREPALSALATANIGDNGLGDRVEAIAGDVGALPRSHLALAADSFTHVIANPPFHDRARGTAAASALKAGAHAMDDGALASWVRAMARFTAGGGTAAMIHKAEALGAVLSAFEGRFGAITVLPIAPRPGAAAIRVLVRGVKGSRAPLTLLAPFVLHGAEGNAFTAQAEAILRHGAGLAV